MKPAYSLFWSGACQTIGFVAGLATANSAVPGISIVAHATTAGIGAQFLKLSLPWVAFNVLLPVGIAASNELAIPGWILAIGALTLISLFIPTLESGVPLYLSSRKMFERVASLLPHDREFSFVDLGCGTSGLLMYLAARFPKGEFVGIELAPVPYALSWIRSIISGHGRVRIVMGSLWNLDLSPFDFIYAFLAPPPMGKVWEKVSVEMKDGGVFLSNSFEVPGVAAEIIEVDGPRQRSLYVYRMSEKGGALASPQRMQ